MAKNRQDRLIDQFPELGPVFNVVSTLSRDNGRFYFHAYLKEVYRVVRRWSKQRIRKRNTRELAAAAELGTSPAAHTFRVVIETTYPSLQAKTASRWTRALEYALYREISAVRLAHFFRRQGGVANCAREAASNLRKRRYRRPTWD